MIEKKDKSHSYKVNFWLDLAIYRVFGILMQKNTVKLKI